MARIGPRRYVRCVPSDVDIAETVAEHQLPVTLSEQSHTREHLADWARRRLRRTEGEDEREWLRDALGALAY